MKPSGNIDCRIWLIGDSNPTAWQDQLQITLDPRHPTRHNIWTPILDAIQEYVFLHAGRRLDSHEVYVRNAVASADSKPPNTARGWPELEIELHEFSALVARHRPKLMVSFGGFAFEFCRRAEAAAFNESIEPRSIKFWNLGEMAREFHARVANTSRPLVPLLHASIARGKFLEAHNAFFQDANYFVETGNLLGQRLLDHHAYDQIWLSQNR